MKKIIKILLCTFLFLLPVSASYGQKSASSDTSKTGGNETINIGYGETRKRDLTGPVEKIDGRKLKNAHYDNIYEMIRGKAAGVEVYGTSVRIRNASSMGTGSDPLFVVDGVPVNTISNIDPEMVRSIEVLKGAAASIYGTRGGNGVILINLKKGNEK